MGYEFKQTDPQRHINFEEAASFVRRDEVARKHNISDEAKADLKENPETGEWELRGIPLSNLDELYKDKDNTEMYNH